MNVFMWVVVIYLGYEFLSCLLTAFVSTTLPPGVRISQLMQAGIIRFGFVSWGIWLLYKGV